MGFITNKYGINLYDKDSLLYLKESGYIANNILLTLVESCIEGSTPKDIQSLSESLISKFKVKSAFMGFEGYPAPVCISYNEKIVHGIPNDYKFQKGDVVSLDFGVIYKKHYSDNARTLIVGDDTNNHSELLDVTVTAFGAGLNKAIAGNTLGDIGHAIHKEILKILSGDKNINRGTKYKLYYKFQGHGIGMSLHEKPGVPNMGYPKKGYILEPGMCICIEPVILYSSSNPKEISTSYPNIIEIVTDDGKPSAHYENQIFITESEPIILTQSN